MDILGILAELHGQRDRISQAIEALESLNGSTSSPRTAKTTPKPAPLATVKGVKAAPVATKRVISPEARQRMAEAQQKRWAKKKRAVKAAAKKAVAAVAPATVKTAKAA